MIDTENVAHLLKRAQSNLISGNRCLYIAVEPSAWYPVLCKQFAEVQLVKMSEKRFPFFGIRSASFDFVFVDSCNSCLSYLDQVYRILKPGGRVYYSFKMVEWFKHNKVQTPSTSKSLLSKLVRKFKFKKLPRAELPIDLGEFVLVAERRGFSHLQVQPEGFLIGDWLNNETLLGRDGVIEVLMDKGIFDNLMTGMEAKVNMKLSTPEDFIAGAQAVCKNTSVFAPQYPMVLSNASQVTYPREYLAQIHKNVSGDPEVLKRIVSSLISECRFDEEKFERILLFCQKAIYRDPLSQPVLPDGSLPSSEVILFGHIGRCGHVSKVLSELLQIAGFETEIWQLKNHVTVKCRLNDRWVLADADIFKNGVLTKIDGQFVGVEEIVKNPFVLDQFPATGWIYNTLPSKSNKVEGYVENVPVHQRGFISNYFQDKVKGYSPGIIDKVDAKIVGMGKVLFYWIAAVIPQSDLLYYSVRISKQSRGWSYQTVTNGDSFQEFKNVVYSEYQTRDTEIELQLDPGNYYVSVYPVTKWINYNSKTYFWPSEELSVTVTPSTVNYSNNHLQWLKDFESKMNRPLRVLHIGNIANNSYLNSKIQREVGIESHVLSYDYYHVMGCPEWEDVFFEESKIDQNRPVWHQIDLKGYRRPTWFVQGALATCFKYLEAVHANRPLAQMFYWHLLCIENQTKKCFIPLQWLKSFSLRVPEFLQRIRSYHDAQLFNRQDLSWWQTYRFNLRNHGYTQSDSKIKNWVKSFIHFLICTAALISRNFVTPKSRQGLDTQSSGYRELINLFNEHFPDRKDQLTLDDVNKYHIYSKQFGRIFDYYDVLHCYSTDVRWPLLTKHKNYVGYEHGTIRTFPFQDTSLSRLVALGYAESSVLMMTNADSIPQAMSLKAGHEEDVIFGLHGFDERMVLDRLNYAEKQRTRAEGRFFIPEETHVFFQAARQDWGIKGNDLVIKAIQMLVARNISNFVVVLAEWGNDIAKSKALVNYFKLEKYVRWTPILSKTNLLHTYACVEGVIDQFVCPCVGAAAIEVLSLNRTPFITRLDDNAMAKFYGTSIPCFNCADEKAIADAMEKIIRDKSAAMEVVRLCGDWVKSKHTHKHVLNLCIQSYRQVLEAEGRIRN